MLGHSFSILLAYYEIRMFLFLVRVYSEFGVASSSRRIRGRGHALRPVGPTLPRWIRLWIGLLSLDFLFEYNLHSKSSMRLPCMIQKNYTEFQPNISENQNNTITDKSTTTDVEDWSIKTESKGQIYLLLQSEIFQDNALKHIKILFFWIDLFKSNIQDLFRIVGSSVIFISVLFFIEFKCSSRKFAVPQKSAGETESIALDDKDCKKSTGKKLSRFELELSGLLFLLGVSRLDISYSSKSLVNWVSISASLP